MINVKYTRIKKPKKDELLIFNLPDELVNGPRHKYFVEMLRQAINDTSGNKQFLIITGKLEIYTAKKKQVKVKNNES